MEQTSLKPSPQGSASAMIPQSYSAQFESKLDSLSRLLIEQSETGRIVKEVHPWQPYLAQIWRRKWMLVLCAILGLLIGFGIDSLRVKQYTAKGTLELLADPGPTLQTKALAAPPVASVGQEVSWEPKVAVLESDALMNRTIDVLGWDNVSQAVESPFKLPGFGGRAGSAASSSELPPVEEQIRLFRKRLTMQLEKGTNLVTISFSSTRPALAAQAVNTLMEQYISFDLDRRVAEARRTRNLLNQQLTDAKKKLESSEAKLEDYARSRGIITVGNNLIGEERVRSIESALSAAEAARTSAQARYNSLAPQESASSPAGIDPTIEQEVARLSELRRELASNSVIYTPSHYKTQQLTAEIHQLEQSIAAAQRDFLLRSKTDFNAASGNENLLKSEYKKNLLALSDQASKAVEYDVRHREVESDRGVYSSVMQAVQETNIAAALDSASAGVLERAGLPVMPSAPIFGLDPILGFVTGLVLSAALIVFWSLADKKIRPENLLSLGSVPTLATIPRLRSVAVRNVPRGGTGKEEESSLTNLASSDAEDPAIAAAIRSTLVSLQMASPQLGFPHVILVTGPESAEGKSFVTTHLAAALPAEGRRVLLIDASLKNPSQYASFGLSNASTWPRYVPGANFNDLSKVDPTGIPNLSLMRVKEPLDGSAASGVGTQNEGQTSLRAPVLSTENLHVLFEQLRNNFEVIVIDTPGVLVEPTVRLWARFAQAVVMVVAPGRTTKSSLGTALQVLARDRAKNVTIVLNNAPASQTHKKPKWSAETSEVAILKLLGTQHGTE